MNLGLSSFPTDTSSSSLLSLRKTPHVQGGGAENSLLSPHNLIPLALLSQSRNNASLSFPLSPLSSLSTLGLLRDPFRARGTKGSGEPEDCI